MFKPVDSKVSFPELEEGVLRFWKEHDIFRKSVEERPEDRLFVFYEGPPTANARPGVHHVLARVYKDLFPRYRTMRGYRVPRKAGWDTHGLPVELEVERELGLKSKPEIESYGIEQFNRRCRESVFRYVREWEALTERIGFWIDMENAYVTYHNEYMESVWWIVRQLWDRGLVYLDYRSTPHCPRCGTSLSDGEVALGYQEDTPDPSIYVKFRLTEESRKRLADKVPGDLPLSLLAWTTTPWTLPGNTALAVLGEAEYAVGEADGEGLIVASALAGAVLPQGSGQAGDEPRVVATLTGEELVGLRYEPLYDPTTWGVQAMAFRHGPSLAPPGTPEVDLSEESEIVRLAPVESAGQVERAYTVIAGEFVSLEDGSGVVHVAPAFGGDDFDIGKRLGLLFLQPVNLRGQMTGGPFNGLFVKDADEPIMRDLAERGLLLRREIIRHTYPFCWRCDTPLLYYAKPTWYIRTTGVKQNLIEGNERINWYPEHIKRGRFGDWLRNNVDWALSRERYWGTPFPVWQCKECGQYTCIGSRDELVDLAVVKDAAARLDDLHRPYVDRIAIRCRQPVLDEVNNRSVECGGMAQRLPEVIDGWFDSGAMPYAQWHYPFENQETFGRSFPADFICEAVDQTRGWFYTLHAEATLLQAADALPESICYRNVICLGLITDDRGRKMSKSLGNVVEPMEVIDAHGADALRWYLYTATRPGETRRFSAQLVAETVRRFLLTLWNTYSFFVTYANIDRFNPSAGSGQVPAKAPAGERSELDRWVLSELNVLIEKVTGYLEQYDPTSAGRAIQGFVEDLSNWYVRRSRRRFWKSGSDADKLAAYHTLYTCLATLCKLVAPFTPFVAEEMYQNLVRSAQTGARPGVDGGAPESVHLAHWPEADRLLVDQQLMDQTRLVMRVVSLGRAARSKAGLKVRQPLAAVAVKPRYPGESEGLKRLESQVLEELNVKQLMIAGQESELAGLAVASDEAGYAVGLDTAVTPELADEGLARELVHRIQNLRKAAGLEISDRIGTYYSGPQALRRALAAHGEYVRQETLSDELVEGDPPAAAYAEQQKLDGEAVTLAVIRLA